MAEKSKRRDIEKTKDINVRKPEEIKALIDALNKEIEEKLNEIEKVKAQSISAAVLSLGEDFRKKYDDFIELRDSLRDTVSKIEDLVTEVNGSVDEFAANREFIRKSLADPKLGLSEGWVNETVGEPIYRLMLNYGAARTTTSRRAGRKITRAKLNDEVITWTELLDKYSIKHDSGQSAHREWEAAKASRADLPDVEVVAV